MDNVMDSAAAERFLGLAKGTLTTWRARKEEDQPPFYRVGGKAIRYKQSDLDEYLNRRRVCVGGQR